MEMTLDDLDSRLADVARLEAILHAEKLDLIAAADRMQAPTADGARNLGEWVARRLDEHPRRARHLARTARSASPDALDALRAGTVSVARADAYIAADAAGIALDGLDRCDITAIWARIRRTTPVSGGVPDRYLVLQPSLSMDHWSLHGRLGAIDGGLVADALTAEADRIVTGVPTSHRPPHHQRMADALVTLALGHGDYTPTITLHADLHAAGPDTAIALAGGLAARTRDLAHALCVGRVDLDTTPWDPGIRTQSRRQRRRAARTLPRRLRRHIEWRDHHACSVDGCDSRHRLQVHHITHKADGGSDDPDNLALLCWFHHHISIHTNGFEIDPTSPPGRRRLVTPSTRGP